MDISIFIFAVISTLLLLIVAIHLIPTSKNSNLPPGPKPFPIIGNLLDLGDKPQKSLTNLANSYGPIMSLKLGQITTIVISSAAMAKEILQTHDHVLSSRAIPDAATPYDHHEFALAWIPVSTLWRNLRRLCSNRLFFPKILDSNKNLRRKKVEELVSYIKINALKGLTVDIGASVYGTTLNLLSNTIFSIDLANPDSEMGKEFRESVKELIFEMGKPNIGDHFSWLKKMDIMGLKKRASVHMGKILEFMDKMINQRLEMQKSTDFIPKNDFLHYLLNVDEENKDINLGQNEIRHLLMVLFIAGTHTSSSATQWAMAHLLQNPEIMSKAKAELKQVIGEGNPVEESDIEKLRYLQAIIKETFRLHSTFLLTRKVGEEITIGGFRIPKNAQILVNNWALGRDPNVWENPESFKPERFMEMEFDIRGRNYELVAFGGGRRICPGIPLAWRMLHLIVGSLVHWFPLIQLFFFLCFHCFSFLKLKDQSMAPIKVHGTPISNATGRVLASLYEKELDYDLVIVKLNEGEHKKEPFLSINPFGQIPGFQDGDLSLFESRAITRYISQNYAANGTELISQDPKEAAIISTWIEVEGHHFDPPASKLAWELCLKPMFGLGEKDAAVVENSEAELAKVLDMYEKKLAQSKYLAGDSFTLADLHHLPILSVLMGTQTKKLFESRPHVNAWVADILARPAWAKVLALRN